MKYSNYSYDTTVMMIYARNKEQRRYIGKRRSSSIVNININSNKKFYIMIQYDEMRVAGGAGETPTVVMGRSWM
eukprot:10840794-Ditylum_brightwellii.AAC.1